jgi:hypothetical protein
MTGDPQFRVGERLPQCPQHVPADRNGRTGLTDRHDALLHKAGTDIYATTERCQVDALGSGCHGRQQPDRVD